MMVGPLPSELEEQPVSPGGELRPLLSRPPLLALHALVALLLLSCGPPVLGVLLEGHHFLKAKLGKKP